MDCNLIVAISVAILCMVCLFALGAAAGILVNTADSALERLDNKRFDE